MERRDFLKKFGITLSGILILPQVFKDTDFNTVITEKGERIESKGGIIDQIRNEKEYVLYTGKIGMKEFEKVIANL